MNKNDPKDFRQIHDHQHVDHKSAMIITSRPGNSQIFNADDDVFQNHNAVLKLN